MQDIVTIGRNVNDEPMSDWLWDEFCSDLVSLFRTGTIVSTVRGTAWTEDWGVEETFIVIGKLGTDNGHEPGQWREGENPRWVDWSTLRLEDLAIKYGQDAIGRGTIDLVVPEGEGDE